MNNLNELNFFKKQLSCSIKYLEFLCGYYEGIPDESNHRKLLKSLLEVKNGICFNPDLIMDLMFPSRAKCGRLSSIKKIGEKLDDNQKLAVEMALATENIVLLQGPPGAGKSTFIVEFVKQLRRKKKDARILITSQTHTAVNNVIQKLDNETFKDEIIRLKLKDTDERYKKFSEQHLFNKILENSPLRNRKILESYNNEENERYGNDFISRGLNLISSKKNFVGITCNAMPAYLFKDGDPFDCVIVDEAAKLTFFELLNIAKVANKLILIGDPLQLPAVLADNDKEKEKSFADFKDFDIEAYNFLNENKYMDYLFDNISKECKTMLKLQYRMSNPIGTFISKTFYNGAFDNGCDIDISDAINFIGYTKKDIINYKNIEQRSNDDAEFSPLKNEYEVVVIKKLLNGVLSKVDRKDIAIITPYRVQADLIKEMIPELDESQISTVDAFQGKEFDYIIFCCTRVAGCTKFLDDSKRINVAISRAIKKIYVIGNYGFLQHKTKYLKALLNFDVDYTHPLTKNRYHYYCKRLKI